MKIAHITNTLHKVHHRCKNAYLVVFGLSVLLITVLSQQVSAESVVGSIQTRINYTANGKTVSFVTFENTVGNALTSHGISLEKNDITDPALTISLIGDEVNVRLIPASSILIDDNGQSWVGRSAYTSTKEILEQLKVAVDKVDIVTTELILNPETENMVGQKISIKRAPVYTVTVDGGQPLVHSWAKTVLAVLTDGGISLNQNDTTDPPRESLAPSSGQIEVVRVNYADFEETVPIAFPQVSQTSYEMYKGQTKVTQAGVNGSKKQSVHVVYHNGVEVSRDVTSSVVLSAAQTQITLVGVKPYNAGMWWDTIVAAGQRYGVPAEDIFSVMVCESGGQPRSGEGRPYNKPKGLFQYIDSTWEGSSLAALGYVADIFDGYKQIEVTAKKVSTQRVPWTGWTCKP